MRLPTGGTASLVGADRALSDQALAHLQFADRWGLLHPTELLRRIATLHCLRGDVHKAEPFLQRALAAAPQDASLHGVWAGVQTTLGQAAADRGDFPDAVRRFGQAVRSQPHAAPHHYNLGVVLAALGCRDEAQREYRAAIELNPTDVEARNNLAYLLIDNGAWDEAASILRRAIEINPEYAPARFNLARALAERGQFAESDRQLRVAARLDPRYAEFLSPGPLPNEPAGTSAP
jgi:Flp pilus assembly protein TadD